MVSDVFTPPAKQRPGECGMTRGVQAANERESSKKRRLWADARSAWCLLGAATYRRLTARTRRSGRRATVSVSLLSGREACEVLA